MSPYEFRLADVGEGIAEAEIAAWYVAAGDRVEEDQPLVDVMTEKVTVAIRRRARHSWSGRTKRSGRLAAG
jgi:2-oxoisovalerate dehydrogenase E2 component (dihydrolipoyl transacylase)